MEREREGEIKWKEERRGRERRRGGRAGDQIKTAKRMGHRGGGKGGRDV